MSPKVTINGAVLSQAEVEFIARAIVEQISSSLVDTSDVDSDAARTGCDILRSLFEDAK